MTDESENVRDRIVTAAIECIEREGVNAATIRSIASEAGVNSAAISYYFRSKDRLLEEARARTLHEGSTKALEELDHYEAETGDLRAAVRQLLVEQFSGMVRYPRIVEWHLLSMPIRASASTPAEEPWDSFFEQFYQRVRPLLAGGSDDERRMAMLQMWSAMLLPAMYPGFQQGLTRLDLRNDEVAIRYIDSLLTRFLDANAGGASE